MQPLPIHRIEIELIPCGHCLVPQPTEWVYEGDLCRGMNPSKDFSLWGDAIICTPCGDKLIKDFPIG